MSTTKETTGSKVGRKEMKLHEMFCCNPYVNNAIVGNILPRKCNFPARINSIGSISQIFEPSHHFLFDSVLLVMSHVLPDWHGYFLIQPIRDHFVISEIVSCPANLQFMRNIASVLIMRLKMHTAQLDSVLVDRQIQVGYFNRNTF